MEHDYQVPPCPTDPGEAARWSETRRKRRLMIGRWDCDLDARLYSHFGGVRRAIIGPGSLAKNPYRRVAWQLASLYTTPPTPTHSNPRGATSALADLLDPGGLIDRAALWHLAPRLQAMTLGLRQMVVAVDADREHGALTYRLVYPDTVTRLKVHPAAPDIPVEIWELRWRETIGRWCWDQLSVVDPANPFFRVVAAGLDGRPGDDVTRDVLGEDLSGPRYPYRWTWGPRRGKPFIPRVLYHAQHTGEVWTPYEWREFLEATLDLAAAWTFWGHSLFKASWPQRWGLDVGVVGETPTDTDAGTRSHVPVDPTSFLHLEVVGGSDHPQVGQWGAGANVLEMQQAISNWERTLADVEGIDAAHLVRESADAWSGAALSISRDGKREAQEVYREPFRRSDLAVLSVSAALVNLTQLLPAQLPEDGYRQNYAPIALSPQELDARRANNNELIDRGRLSTIDAYMSEHPGMTRKEARAELERIAEEEAWLKGLRPAPPPPPAPPVSPQPPGESPPDPNQPAQP